MNTLVIGISYIENDIVYGLYDNNNLRTIFTLEQINNVENIHIDNYKIINQRVVYEE